MKLGQLMSGVAVVDGLDANAAQLEIAGVEYDSRRVAAGGLFFAFPGAKADGRAFAQSALDKGAVAVVSESPKPADFAGRWIQVEHGRRTLAHVAREFYARPDEALQLVGMTGTNGKTTTVFLIDAMLRATGAKTGLVGTIQYHVCGEPRAAVNTTPESLDLMRLMAETRDKGGRYFSFEVSSHALALGRVHGLQFAVAAFSNLTRDHLDFHKTMEAYFDAKQMLFDGAGGPPPKCAVLNADDEWGAKMRTAASTRVLRYGIRNECELRARDVHTGFEGVRFRVEHDGHNVEIVSPLCGLINVYNLLTAYGSGIGLGLTPEQAAAGVASLRAVPGRFERVDAGQPFLVVVDYAHTDDALRNTIATARALKPKRVITLFGCGGDRDRTKRPLMGSAAAELSDLVIVTSDNPRSEDPLAIINDAMVGVQRHSTRHIVEPDRHTAIETAMREARSGDIVILAGKGHETYQILKDRVIDFDDREQTRAALRGAGYGVK